MGNFYPLPLFIYSLLTLQMTHCSISKDCFESLLSNYFLKGYDLIVSLKRDSEENLLSWLKEGNNSEYSILLENSDLYETLESVRDKSRSLEQIAIIIEFRNISHLQEQMKMAKEYSQNTTVPQPYFFIVTSDSQTYEQLSHNETRLQQLSLQFSINSDFYIFGETLDDKQNSGKPTINLASESEYSGYPFPAGFGLTELYSLKNITFLQSVSLRSHSLLQKVIRRANFRQARITAVAQHGQLGAVFSEDNTTFVSGHEVDQLNFLARSFNFTVVPKLGTGWITLENNTLKGMGEQLINREADIAISSSEMVLDRAAQLTFLHPTYYTTVWGFFKQPSSNLLRDIFINAFTLDLWLTMFATWLLIIMAMIALAIVKWRLGTLHENDKIVVQEVFIWACGAICQQGWHVCPESGCMKIVFIFALITGLVSYVGYSAALVSILSVKVVPIQTLDDLIKNRYVLYTDNETISTNNIAKDLESRLKLLPFQERSVNTDAAMQKLLTTHSAFLGVADVFYPAARLSLCSDLQICKAIHRVSISRNRPVQGGMFIRKRSSFTDFFNHRVLVLYERGIRYRLLEKFFRETSVMCLDLNASEKEPLGFNDVVTAYVILLIGYILSLSLLVLEKLCSTSLRIASPAVLNDNQLIGPIHFQNF